MLLEVICNGSSIWPGRSLGISRRNRKRRVLRRAAVWEVSSIRCYSPNNAFEMFRRSLPDVPPKHRLEQLANRLAKILAETRKLNPAE
jgi:hypothetical protein